MDELPLQCSVVISKIGEVPSVELRRRVTEYELLKRVVWCALHERPITIVPKFSDRMRSIAHLIEIGVVYYDKEKEQYFFVE